MAKTSRIRKTSTLALARQKSRLLRQMGTPSCLLRASYVRQYLTCGKANCRCRRGLKHGPFFYLVQCLPGGTIRKFLLKTPKQRQQARAGITAHLEYQVRRDTLSEINAELLRRGKL